MIYLIKTSMLVLDEVDPNKDYTIPILKIGYSSDKRGNKRFKDYETAGLSIRILKTISGGSVDLESAIHHKFIKYRIPNKGKEWFYYKEEIIDYFEQHNTVKELHDSINSESIDKVLFKLRSDLVIQDISLCRKVISYLGRSENNPFLSKRKKKNIGFLIDNIIMFTSYPTFREKMKFICSLPLDELQGLFMLIPKKYKDYFITIGPQKMKELLFSKKEMDSLYQTNKEKIIKSLESEIISEFEVNRFYSIQDIKINLWRVYNKLDIKKTPKAIDLQKVFEIKRGSIIINDGIRKRLHGYQILSIKYPEMNKTPEIS